MNDFRGKEIKKGQIGVYFRKSPGMTTIMHAKVFGMTASKVQIGTCYRTQDVKSLTEPNRTVDPENIVIVED